MFPDVEVVRQGLYLGVLVGLDAAGHAWAAIVGKFRHRVRHVAGMPLHFHQRAAASHSSILDQIDAAVEHAGSLEAALLVQRCIRWRSSGVAVALRHAREASLGLPLGVREEATCQSRAVRPFRGD